MYNRKYLPLGKGSLVYRPAPVAGTPGVLYIVWQDLNPTTDEQLVDGLPDVAVAELLCLPAARGKGRSSIYNLDNRVVKDSHGRRPASFSGFQGVVASPWYEGGDVLWSVDELVREVQPTWTVAPPKASEGQAAQWARKAFNFDYREAERLIASALSHPPTLAVATAGGSVSCVS